MTLDVTVPLLQASVTESINNIILRHNQACAQSQSRAESAREQLEADAIAGSLEEYRVLKAAVKAAEDKAVEAERNIGRLSSDIKVLERELVEHRQPAEELNEELLGYLGHNELRLEVKDEQNDPGYMVVRAGTRASSISEGEVTAIALLYFLKSLRCKDFDLASGVVVLDDPVSSLDQNALYAAYSFIRTQTQDAAQLFIMAHNFTFFRLVREWYKHLRAPNKKAWRIYMLRCRPDPVERRANLEAIDTLLMGYESEYHYLFKQLYQLATGAPTGKLESYYGAPSIARRVLETFLAFRVPGAQGESTLLAQMLEIPFDEWRRSRLYRFLQTHSHRDAIGGADEDLTLLTETRSVLQDLLQFMQEADDGHVSRMIALVASSDSTGE